MKTFIALLRGINVGGRNILPMQDLRLLLEKNACHNVKTYIQSGNVVFDCVQAPANISELIKKQHGFKPEVLFLSKNEFLKVTRANPYASSQGKDIHFYFCKGQPKPDVAKLDELKAESERYSIIGKLCYLYAPDGIGRSKLVAKLEKCLGVAATGRNLNTIIKLTKMIDTSLPLPKSAQFF